MKQKELIEALVDRGIPREDAEPEARILFEKLGGVSPIRLLTSDPDLPSDVFGKALSRRAEGEPLAYILGEIGFYKESYFVTPDVLIPRSDTEHLVEYAVRHLPENAVFADLCTGSGCIAISILANRPDTRAIAVDLSDAALAIARKNAERNGVLSRIDFVKQDVLLPFPLPKCDAILSNPPYIASKIIPTLSREVSREPSLALDGGADGLLFYRTMLAYLPSLIKERGFLLFEIGYDQRESLLALSKDLSLSCEVRSDYGGNPRMAILRRP